MRKSLAYQLAQYSVINDPDLRPNEKVDILRVLMDGEKASLYWEQYESEGEKTE